MLIVRHTDGPLAGQEQRFGPEFDRIVFGRDRDFCQVVFPPDCTAVGRRHVALIREPSGDYAIDPFGEHYVGLDGHAVESGQQLPRQAALRLGNDDGPGFSVAVEADQSEREGGLKLTEPQKRAAPLRAMLSRGVRIGLVLFLATAAVGAGAGIWTWRANRNQAELQARLAGDVAQMLARERIQAAERIPGGEKQRLSASVFAVLLREPSGRETLFGTAWPVTDRLLATNAHVAAEFKTLRTGQSLVVRPPGSADSIYDITGVTIHPGYVAFREFLERDPFYVDTARGQPRLSVVPAYDVALLQLAKPVPPATVLRLADDGDLAELAAGNALAFAGYPYERVKGSDVQPIGRTPQLQAGAVTALTDNFLLPAEQAQRKLIHHSLPATGGASGSPIINARGHVVGLLSAGNVTMLSGNSRIPNAVQINYAQRVDLLRDLIDQKASDRLASDRRYWDERSAVFKRGEDLIIPALLEDARPSPRHRPVLAWEQRAQFVTAADRTKRTVSDEDEGDGEFIRSRSFTLSVKAGSQHVFVLYGEGGKAVTALTVVVDGRPVRRGLGSGDQWAAVRYTAPAADATITLVVDMPDTDGRFLVRDYVWSEPSG